MSSWTEADKARVLAAVEFVHDLNCSRTWEHDFKMCGSSRFLANRATLVALETLDVRPRDAKTVRLVLHAGACRSGCTGAEAEDHARRTQSKTAAALRKFHAQEGK